jgi:hypothetical protein
MDDVAMITVALEMDGTFFEPLVGAEGWANLVP